MHKCDCVHFLSNKYSLRCKLRKVAHGSRITFPDACRNANVELCISGWTLGDASRGGRPGTLSECISKYVANTERLMQYGFAHVFSCNFVFMMSQSRARTRGTLLCKHGSPTSAAWQFGGWNLRSFATHGGSAEISSHTREKCWACLQIGTESATSSTWRGSGRGCPSPSCTV